MPLITSTPAPRGLLFGHKDAPLGSAIRGSFQGQSIGRARAIVMMDLFPENGAAHQRLDHFWQEQIRNSSQLIPTGRMPSDLYSQSAQLLHQAPYFRSRRADLLSKFRPTNNDSRKV